LAFCKTQGDDVRVALQRVPAHEALAALQSGLAAAPDDFELAIAASLQGRLR